MKKIKRGPLLTTYKGRIFTITEQDVELPNGEKTVFEYCERPASVSIVAFNEKGELLLIREWRDGYGKHVWFLPSGRVDHPGDTPKKAAIRELREETGYRPKRIKLLHKRTAGPTLHWNIYIYVAKDLVIDPLPCDSGERIVPHFVPFKKAVQMALDGTIENEYIAYTIIRLNYMIKNGEFIW